MQTPVTEQSIISLIREGKTNKEIGHVFNLSEVAVKNRIHRLLRKHNCKNRVQLALQESVIKRYATER